MRNQQHAPVPTGITLAYIGFLTAFAVLYRLGPYYFGLGTDAQFFWNLTPVGALGLFAGARLRSPLAWLVPVVAMVLSDLLLIRPLAEAGYSAYSGRTPVLYLSFAVYALLGYLAGRASGAWQVPGVVGACLAGSVQFFVLSNFATWLFYFPNTWAGLVDCYNQAWPFFRNTAGGDLLFTAGFFALHLGLLYLFEPKKASQPA